MLSTSQACTSACPCPVGVNVSLGSIGRLDLYKVGSLGSLGGPRPSTGDKFVDLV